jgi:hypothetical protein
VTLDEAGRHAAKDFSVTDRRHGAPGSQNIGFTSAESFTRAAVAALNRRDHLFAVRAATVLAADHRSTTTAFEILIGILLHGIPRGSLKPGTRIDVEFRPTPGDPDCPKARDLARDLLTAFATGDDQAVSGIRRSMSVETSADVLIVLLHSVAARLEHFVGLEGDTGDAYYAAVNAS